MQNTYDFTPCQCKDCGAWTADIFPAEEELAKWEKERLHDEMIRTLGVIPFWGFGAKAESGEDMQESLRSGSPQKKYLSGARGAGAAHVGAEVADGGQADKGEKGTGRSGEAEKGNLWAGVASLGDKQGEQGFCSLRREGQKSRGWSLWNLGTALGMGWGAWGEKGGEQHFGSNAEVDFGKGKCYEDESKKQDVMLQTEQMQTAIHGQKEPTMDEALEIFNALDANHDGTLQAYEILIEMDQLG